jgi:hypothetical protein
MRRVALGVQPPKSMPPDQWDVCESASVLTGLLDLEVVRTLGAVDGARCILSGVGTGEHVECAGLGSGPKESSAHAMPGLMKLQQMPGESRGRLRQC